VKLSHTSLPKLQVNVLLMMLELKAWHQPKKIATILKLPFKVWYVN
jgi:hypothetical protein